MEAAEGLVLWLERLCEVEWAQSGKFPVTRGIHQGSVLSPVLFLMVMDPLLQQLEKSALVPSINNLYVWSFLHADDIQTLASSLEVLDAQVSLVQGFAKENFLKLNTQKCEVVVFASDPHAPYSDIGVGIGEARGGPPNILFSKLYSYSYMQRRSPCHSVYYVQPSKWNCFLVPTPMPECKIAEQAISVGSEGKCFGYWWPGNLMANRAVEEGIKKARRSFFHHGAAIGVFQGDLSPLSSRAVVESCVMPVLLYSCENMGFNGAANFP